MKKLLFILSICIFAKAGFAQTLADGYQNGDEGMEYKIIREGNNNLLKPGQFLELHFVNVLFRAGKLDSILNSTREMGVPQFMAFDSVSIPPAYFKIFSQMNEGDSVSTRTLADSMFKNKNSEMPPFILFGDFIYTNIKVVKVYKTQAETDSARQIAMENAEKFLTEKAAILKISDDKSIADFIAKNNIKAIKTNKGVYVETVKKGIGPFLNNKSIVKIKYKGKTINGVMFDTNMEPNKDPAKTHLDALTVNLSNDKSLGNGVIPGLENGMYKMQVGSKVNIYIPSGLAYGARGGGKDIPANSILIFEIEVLKILTKAQFKVEKIAAVAKEKKEQKIKDAEQKKYMEKLKKSDPKKYEELKQQMMQLQDKTIGEPNG